MPVPVAALVAAAVVGLAWRARALTTSGALAAWTVGMAVLLGTGWAGGAVLAAFFVSSTAVSRLTAARAASDAKGERRDHWQVYANGGVAALGALTGLLHPSADPTVSLGIWLATSALAAAAADTWATSTGRLSPTRPRLLGLGRPVPPGTNGGMTAAGSAGALIGALLVAATGALAARAPLLLPAATLIGFVGMVADSALGASLQGRFACPACRQPSEWRTHRCGAPTVHQGGLRWLTNDGVNFLATALAGAAGLAAWAWVGPRG